MNILSKEADRGFKIYCLCSENYLYAFVYASKTTKIVDLQDFTPSASMVVQIVKSLPRFYEYVVCYDPSYASSLIAMLVTMLMAILRAIADRSPLGHRLVPKPTLFRVSLCSPESYPFARWLWSHPKYSIRSPL